MKKFFLSALFILSFSLYIIYKKNDDLTRRFALNRSYTNTNTSTDVISASQGSISASAGPAPTLTPVITNALYKDGVYTGLSADAYYGNIQVQANINGGRLTNVVFLDYPQDRSNSVRINTIAMPYLKTEAIQAQSANVDIISGATDSSFAFRQSLADALNQAKNQ